MSSVSKQDAINHNKLEIEQKKIIQEVLGNQKKTNLDFVGCILKYTYIFAWITNTVCNKNTIKYRSADPALTKGFGHVLRNIHILKICCKSSEDTEYLHSATGPNNPNYTTIRRMKSLCTIQHT